jgi:hypothetical protein
MILWADGYLHSKFCFQVILGRVEMNALDSWFEDDREASIKRRVSSVEYRPII